MTSPIAIGTRVRTNLYGRGYGTVFAIHGEQAPETVQTIGGIIAMGGRATFDIVFDCGSMSKQLPECILRGVQWRVLDETIDAAVIAAAVAFAEAESARRTTQATVAKQRFADETNRLRADPRFTRLIQGDDASSGKLAAKNVRLQLHDAFPETKFSVRVRDHGSIDIAWTDGPTTAQVKLIATAHEGGRFDGMADIYEHKATPWTRVFGGSEYIFLARTASDRLLTTSIAAVFADNAGNFIGSGITATAADYRRLFSVTIPGLDCSLELEIRKAAATTTG